MFADPVTATADSTPRWIVQKFPTTSRMKAKISSYHGHHIHDFNVVVRNPLEHTDCAKRGDTLPSKLLVKVAHLLALIKNIWVPCHKFTVDVYLMEREIIIPYSSYKKDLKQ